MRAHNARPSRRLLPSIIAFTLIATLFGPGPQPASAAFFTDIGSSKFRSEIVWLADVGVTTGCGSGRFCPKGAVTRGQMATFLARAFKLPATSRDFFRDDGSNKHEGSINRLAAAGITAGCADGRYCPDGLVTRAQMASFLARALDLPATSRDYYRDDNRNKHEANINRFAAEGITRGCGAGVFCPNGIVVREQMAAFLYRAREHLDLKPISSTPVAARQRPYTASSAWNTPIGSGAAVDSNSARMIATIGDELSSDPTQYTFPVYYATASTPRHSVSCRVYSCTVVTSSGHSTTRTLTGVPIPAGAEPSRGSDGQMIIIDLETGTEWDLWQASYEGGRWSVSNGSVYNVRWNGMPTRYGSRGAGVPYLAGLIRPWEIEAGRIDHALAFAYPSPRDGRCVWPASKTDGQSSNQYAIPEGARIQLDPRYTDADFRQWGLDRTGRIIARALQEYGMFLIDVSGRPKIYVEDLAANPYATRSWNESAIRLTSSTVEEIPVSALRVLRLPSAYWSGGSGSRHGDCFR